MIKIDLKVLAAQKNIKLRDIAKGTQIPEVRIYDMANGKQNGIKFDHLERLCAFLKCSPSDLLIIKEGNEMEGLTGLDFTAVAKMFNIARNDLFKLCRDKNYLEENNDPYPEFIESGLFEILTITKNTDSDFRQTFSKTLITEKGIEEIRKLINNRKEN